MQHFNTISVLLGQKMSWDILFTMNPSEHLPVWGGDSARFAVLSKLPTLTLDGVWHFGVEHRGQSGTLFLSCVTHQATTKSF